MRKALSVFLTALVALTTFILTPMPAAYALTVVESQSTNITGDRFWIDGGMLITFRSSGRAAVSTNNGLTWASWTAPSSISGVGNRVKIDADWDSSRKVLWAIGFYESAYDLNIVVFKVAYSAGNFDVSQETVKSYTGSSVNRYEYSFNGGGTVHVVNGVPVVSYLTWYAANTYLNRAYLLSVNPNTLKASSEVQIVNKGASSGVVDSINSQ